MSLQSETITKRSIVLLGLIGLLFLVVLGRFAYIMLFLKGNIQGLSSGQIEGVYPGRPRGQIVDTRGNILATTVLKKSLAANPGRINHPRKTSERLAVVLGRSPRELYQRLTRETSFVWLKRKLNEPAVKKIQRLEIDGLFFVPEHKRVYPQGTLASHVLGFVGIDNQGLAGVEQSHDGLLSENKSYDKNWPFEETTKRMPTLQLTINQTIQYIVEEELTRTVKQVQPEVAMVVVLEPESGKVLAMANRPTFNPNHYQKYKPEDRRNRAILNLFEPGSTLKAMNMAIGLENNVFSAGTTYMDRKGYVYLPDARATIHDYAVHGEVTIPEILIKSCNVGAVKAVNDISAKTYYTSLREFGFGMETGITLPGEASGVLHHPSEWSALTQPNMAIGQGISTTALQMTVAFSVLANNGLLMKPRVIQAKDFPRGRLRKTKPFRVRRVVSKSVAGKITSYLEDVVRQGTGKKANSRDYRFAGKTGTAQVPNPRTGGYYKNRVLASFIGYGSLPEPELVTGVFIKNPAKGKYGGEVAAPLFRRIMKRSLDLVIQR